jgi:2-polyprenyl-6-methoxyphenol hydroxylase-like FAD-dependent oxidoreductase
MSRTDETDVLVVGAGPVGMLTALLLAEDGIRVKIIDKEERTAAHSYACVLHPAALELLARIGLVEEIRAIGWPVRTLAFYEGDSRRAEIKFSGLSGTFREALALPQSTLEQILETRLLALSGIKVLWNHRLMDLQLDQDSVVASIDKLGQTAKGYIVAEWDWTVEKQIETRAAFVIGADGHDSKVRSLLGIDYERIAGPEQFAVFEFETDGDIGNEIGIAMDEATTNVLWRLPNETCRWTFQLVKTSSAGEFPAKDRETLRYVRQEVDERLKQTVERLARNRAPWFKGSVKSIQWSARIQFEHRLAKQFGNNRAWLVGDAAHQTGPVGGQSMNAGLLEAADLARALKNILHEGGPRQLLQGYDQVHRAWWERLLNRNGLLRAKSSTSEWVKDNADRIISCLPVTGEHLVQAMDQLGCEFGPASPAEDALNQNRKLRAFL